MAYLEFDRASWVCWNVWHARGVYQLWGGGFHSNSKRTGLVMIGRVQIRTRVDFRCGPLEPLMHGSLSL